MKLYEEAMKPVKDLSTDLLRYIDDISRMRHLNPAHSLLSISIAVTAGIRSAKRTGNMPAVLRVVLIAFLTEALDELRKE